MEKFNCHDKIPWHFPDISQMAKIPWHFFKIPWQFPDLEKILFFPDFSLTRGNPVVVFTLSSLFPVPSHVRWLMALFKVVRFFTTKSIYQSTSFSMTSFWKCKETSVSASCNGVEVRESCYLFKFLLSVRFSMFHFVTQSASFSLLQWNAALLIPKLTSRIVVSYFTKANQNEKV